MSGSRAVEAEGIRRRRTKEGTKGTPHHFSLFSEDLSVGLQGVMRMRMMRSWKRKEERKEGRKSNRRR